MAQQEPSDSAIEEALAGTTTVTGEQIIECQILSYRALDKLAEKIAKRVSAKELKPNTIVIYNESDIAAQTGLRAFEAQLNLMEKELASEIDTARKLVATAQATDRELGATLAIASATVNTALRSAADLVSLFKIDMKLDYKSWTIADSALVAAVANQLDAKGIAVHHPAIIPVGLFDGASDLMKKITALMEKRGEIEGFQISLAQRQAQMKAEMQALSVEIANAAASIPVKNSQALQATFDQKSRDVEVIAHTIVRLQLAGTAFDAFQTALLKADAPSGANVLFGLLRAEKIGKFANSHWLVLKTVSAGGGYKTKRWLWWLTTKVLYSGGVIAEFMVLDRNGKVVCSGVEWDYSGFLQIGDKNSVPENT